VCVGEVIVWRSLNSSWEVALGQTPRRIAARALGANRAQAFGCLSQPVAKR
jgi:hypothetical protein